MSTPRLLKTGEEHKQHRPPCRLAGNARCLHVVRHSALDLIPVELAGRVAIGNPGSLHGACFDCLLIIEPIEQALVVLVQQIVPNRSFNFVAIGELPVGSGTHVADASIRDKIEQASPFTLVDIVFVLC